MLSESLSKHVILESNRIFIDIAEYGCGSKCAYCYVPDHSQPQVLFSWEQIESICAAITDRMNCEEKIISLCPNTEPLKSPASIERTLYLSRHFLSLGACLQISTKESIPEDFLEELNKIGPGRVFLNISVPYIYRSNLIETGAAPVEQRLENFSKISLYSGLRSCLYIKPYSPKSPSEQKRYVEVIRQYQINTVCVGVQFHPKKATPPCTSLHHHKTASDLLLHQSASINDFIALLRQETLASVYGSSLCCIQCQSSPPCALQLFRYNDTLCQDCSVWRHL